MTFEKIGQTGTKPVGIADALDGGADRLRLFDEKTDKGTMIGAGPRRDQIGPRIGKAPLQ